MLSFCLFLNVVIIPSSLFKLVSVFCDGECLGFRTGDASRLQLFCNGSQTRRQNIVFLGETSCEDSVKTGVLRAISPPTFLQQC